MHGDDRLRARPHTPRDVLQVEVHRGRVDIGEHWRRAAAGHGLGRRIEGECRADDLVTGPDAEGVQREHERVGAVRDADRLAHPEIVRGLALERGHVRAQDEVGAREHTVDRLADARQQRLVLRLYVNERDRTHAGKV